MAPPGRGALWHAYEILYKFEDHLTEPARYGDGTAGTSQRLRGGAVAERPPHTVTGLARRQIFCPAPRRLAVFFIAKEIKVLVFRCDNIGIIALRILMCCSVLFLCLFTRCLCQSHWPPCASSAVKLSSVNLRLGAVLHDRRGRLHSNMDQAGVCACECGECVECGECGDRNCGECGARHTGKPSPHYATRRA